MDKLIIKQASYEDIAVICDILQEAANWCHENGISSWSKEELTWEGLNTYYNYDEFYLGYLDDSPVAVMVLLYYDSKFWSKIRKGEALILHKLAVRRRVAGKGFSVEMINYAKQKAKSIGVKTLRLDTIGERCKLREFYEKQGFKLYDKIKINDREFALYICYLS